MQKKAVEAAANGADGGVRYKNTFDCLIKTYRNEGIRGLQSGLFASTVKEGTKNFISIKDEPF